MIIVKNLSDTYPKSKEIVLKNLGFKKKQDEIFSFRKFGRGKSTIQTAYQIAEAGKLLLAEYDAGIKNGYVPLRTQLCKRD
jgi:energy-coupling factor transporter ATP-binding protein EcfA2